VGECPKRKDSDPGPVRLNETLGQARGKSMQPTVLLLPGIGNSGPQHWQTVWETAHPSFRRVNQRDWDHPVCDEWVEALDVAVTSSPQRVVLAAHSLACLLVAHWATKFSRPIRGAFLAAVPDPEGSNFPKEATGFSPVPLEPFPFPSIVVASSDDPYAGLGHAKRCASAWGSRFVEIREAGHINASSGLGEWHEGLALLQQLLA